MTFAMAYVPSNDVPTWDGNASTFDSFVVSCKWFRKSLKESEQKQAASKVWQRLTGVAKSVVRHLDPDKFEDAEGLDRLLEVLRRSPLQSLPVPDSFARLEAWNGLRRFDRESVPELLVREEDLFVQLQQSLQRARKDRLGDVGRPGARIEPSSTPSQSPLSGAVHRRRERLIEEQAEGAEEPSTTMPGSADFFEDEMRGYRLLKAARLSHTERQHVLSQTRNSTHFEQIRLALRTLFADDATNMRRPGIPVGKVWWNEHQLADSEWDNGYYDDESVNWNDWTATWDEQWNDDWDTQDTYLTGSDWGETYYEQSDWESTDLIPNAESEDPEERQFSEAYSLANEANKTLQQARDAVKRVRQARGYYAPESVSGKGKAKSFASSSKGGSPISPGSQKGYQREGCFICGKPGHGYMQCPDRFSKGKGKTKSKGFSKGKKGKGFGKKGSSKGKSMNYVEYPVWDSDNYVQTIAAQWDEWTMHSRPHTRVILDTGATENAIGVDALSDLVLAGCFHYDVTQEDLPTFRFGNGHRDQAKSRVDLYGTALGDISFYVLDGMARTTPPLVGAKTLREKHSMLSYSSGLFMFEVNKGGYGAVQMQALTSGHVTIDLAETPTSLPPNVGQVFKDLYAFGNNTWDKSEDVMIGPLSEQETAVPGIFMIHTIEDEQEMIRGGPQCLASRLTGLRERLTSLRSHGFSSADLMRRPSTCRLPMLWPAQGGKGQEQSACHMGELCEVWFEDSVCIQEGDARQRQGHGTRSRNHPTVDAGTGSIDSGQSGQCRHGEWEDLGGERKDVASWHQDLDGGEHDLPRVCGQDQSTWSTGWVHESGSGTTTIEGAVIGKCGSIVGGNGPSADSGDSASDRPKQQETKEECEPNSKDDNEGEEGEGDPKTELSDGKLLHGDPLGWGGGSSGPTGSVTALQRSIENVKIGLKKLQEARGKSGFRDLSCINGGATRPSDLCYAEKPLRDESKIVNDLAFSPDAMMEQGLVAGHTSTNDDTTKNSKNIKDDLHCDDTCTCTTKNSKTHKNSFCHMAVDRHGDPAPFQGQQVNKWDEGVKRQHKDNHVSFNTAMKLSKNAAFLGAMMMAPLTGLFSQMQNSPDFVEVACSPTSSLSTAFEKMGYTTKRINYREGYDLENRTGTKLFQQEVKMHRPRMIWVSLPCTRNSPLTNLTQRNEEQWAAFEKRQARDMKRAEEVSDGVCDTLEGGTDFAWEWPSNAAKGWRSKAIAKLIRRMRQLNRPIFWCKLHGCAYGLTFNGVPVMKQWTVLTSSRSLWLALQKRCPGHESHAECRGVIAQASAYYPAAMVTAVTKAMISSWNSPDERCDVSFVGDVEKYLLEAVNDGQVDDFFEQVREEEPQVLALSRNRFPSSPPQGKQLDSIRQMMLRIHRASGHSSFGNLQKLLKMREAPEWAVEMAGKLECPDCVEARLPRPKPPASTGELPALMEQIGADTFEVEIPQVESDKPIKLKFILWRDRASGFVMVDLLQRYTGSWEPKTSDIIKSFSKWLMQQPSPRWVITDPATCFTSQEWLDFLSRSGVGSLTTPAEAHWLLGAEEGCINILKSTLKRIQKEAPDLDPEISMNLAAHGHNSTIGASGFSPFQWLRGTGVTDDFQMPAETLPGKSFGGLMKMREMAQLAYQREWAKARMSKLNNAIARPPSKYSPGDLVMLWRQQSRPGKTTGRWTGPLRLLLQESKVVWLASGTALIKATTTQVSKVTKREELLASTEGTVVYRMPISLDTLMKTFTGRHYHNVTGEAPSPQQQQADLSPADVLQEPAQRPRVDSWRIDNGKWMVRVHSTPRLALFSPSGRSTCPFSDEQLTGVRKTILRPLVEGAPEVTIDDDFKMSDDPQRLLQERWTGETHFEIKPEHVTKSLKRQQEPERKRSRPGADQDIQGRQVPRIQEPSQSSISQREEDPGDVIFPNASDLTTALQGKGPNAVDGVPDIPSQRDGSNNTCPVPSCELPGGHDGPHEDVERRSFSWTPYGGRVNVNETSSEESDGSEELVPDHMTPSGSPRSSPQKRPVETSDHDDFYALEIEIEDEDLIYLSQKPHKSAIWLSKKVQQKGKESQWSRLSLEEKKSFDIAQAKEISNVVTSGALRSLTNQEWDDLDLKRVMQMRWVLTTKQDGTSKARLVVLGFQAHNICEVQSAAPTMARLSRNLLLTVAANNGFKIRAGDVTSAFLQADESLEDEDLVIWAPSELAVMFGADPSHPILPLKIRKAFYGLVHAPRAWYNHVVKTMISQGWQQLISDRCIFILLENQQLVGIAGLHVDDFLIGGTEGNSTYDTAMKKLQASYRWGKWSEGSFEFAGCHIQQFVDMSIKIDQEEYTNRWIDEISITKDREKDLKSPASPKEISMLRAAIGTIAWRSSQSAPQFQADAGLLLSEIPFATVSTLVKVNKLIREMKRESKQGLIYPNWKCDWRQLAILGWADASQKSRPDQSSTMGTVIGVAPCDILQGEEQVVALVAWRSSKTPRQVLGSNGAEVQAITVTEDDVFHVRTLLMEMNGVTIQRTNIYQQVKEHTKGAVIMDSRGIFDASTRNLSSLHGLRSSRAGYELTLAVGQALQVGTVFRWVHGGVQLGDALTKWGSRKVLLEFMARGQRWRLIHDPSFESNRKVKKRELERRIQETEQSFVVQISKLAKECRWPWEPDINQNVLRNMGDARFDHDIEHVVYM